MLKQATSVVKSTKRSHTCKFTLVKCFTELLPALDKVYWCLRYQENNNFSHYIVYKISRDGSRVLFIVYIYVEQLIICI